MFQRVLCVLALLATTSAGVFTAAEDDVLVLTDASFDAAIAEHSIILVEFYAPWCGHCKKLEPEYNEAAATLKKSAPDVRLAKMDATEHRDAAAKFDVKGFPTLKFFNNGVAAEYSGGRTAKDIVNYMVKKSGPAAATVASAEDKEKLMSGDNEISVLGYFADVESVQAKAFLAAAGGDDMDAMSFGITTDATLVGGVALKGDAIALYKGFDEGKNELEVSATTTQAEMSEFVGKYSLRLVTVFSPETQAGIFGGSVKIHALMFVKQDADHYEPSLATLEEAAGTHRGKVLHVAVPSTESRIMEYFGFDDDVLPKLVLADMSKGNMKQYMYPDKKVTAADLIQFENDFFAKKLIPTLKSEEPSDEDDKDDVIVLKGKSFASKVLDNKKNVFVKFYAPWCGHCKTLAPKWEALAEKFSDDDNVVVAKMDSTANEIDVEGVDVSGFPTLYWFGAESKDKPQPYGGARELDDLVKFVHTETGGTAAAAASDEL
jgi:protein disulfide-isomerase A1